ncbi:hypothetical protein [Micromonospora parathelypteridis]|uniref:Uncharacterized protein n=1 Tax=Micromonospora parathelypteridis TaxID=1839617 RepID=A0A840VWV7_9ACTN|nr:hypothetical protein [Micromonospora parathelypteridis]MBB5478384.1 hypothetical protein [Micromonospora parathelypteridis]
MVGSEWQGETCPGCGGELRLLGFALTRRDEDDRFVCKTPLFCRSCGKTWSRWADRPGQPLTEDPLLAPEALKPSRKRRKWRRTK